ncbi:MAG: hypothetical protein U0T73_06125 [Chitinophagales bacterium]
MWLIHAPFLRYAAMALFPFILVREKHFKEDLILVNHERIHLRQQLELLLLFFYIAYVLHYLFNLVKYRNHHRAYREIIFEREAYTEEGDLSYLKRRQFWAWRKY